MELPIDYTKADRSKRREAREQYIKEQNGKCYWCGEPLASQTTEKPKINWRLFPDGFLNYPTHLQHCHKTGMTEGAVHAYCNAVMWQYHGR